MSPEQAAGKDDIDHRSDIWSLGIVLYELLVGAPPHKKAKSLDELIKAIGAEEPAPLRDQAEWVAPELAEVVHAALRLDPNDRYQSAEEMCRALEAYVPSSWRISEDHLVALTDEQRSPWSPEEDTRRVKLAAAIAAEVERAAGDGDDAAPEDEDEPVGDDGDHGEAAETDDDDREGEVVPDSTPPATDDPEQAADGAEPADDEPPEPRDSAAPAAAAETTEPPSPSGQRGLMAVGIGLVVGLLVIIGYVAFGSGDGPGETASPATTAQDTAAVTTTAATSAGGASATATTTDAGPQPDGGAGGAAADDGGADAADGQAQTVRLKITPAFAAVAVDGERAQPEDGYVELSGEEGSVHKVVVTVAGKTKTVRVTLTADGPKPPHIIFVPGGGGRRPKPIVDDDLYE